MQTVRVNAGGGYDVSIGRGILKDCGEMIKSAAGHCRAAVITDSTVEKLYLPAVRERLLEAGIPACSFSFPAGEKSKNMAVLSDILEFLAENRLTRADCVIALGGGVAGDLAGFAAGCYLRGVRFIQIPTTLLAAVDSSVGGKTAVDLKAGKNLAGLFLQPSAVICDTACLGTLPKDVFSDGAAEAIKTGMLSDEGLFGLFESGRAKEQITDVIARCVAYKGAVVEADEFEKGPRRALNLGHTVGHAVEKLSGYAIPHGHAVAIGTAVITRAAAALGYCDSGYADRVERVLEKNDLPARSPYSAAELFEAAMSDKKRDGDGITLVIPRSVGSFELKKVPVSELLPILRAGTGERA